MKRSLFEKIIKLHWGLIFLIILMSSIGFAILYSAAEGNLEPWALKQIIRFAAFFPIMLIIALVDIKFWYKSGYIIYFIVLALLVLVEVMGVTAMGATRWVRLAGITIQPSELMKVAIIFALAKYFHSIHINDIGKITILIPPLLIIAIPFILIVKQPDLGTALIILMLAAMIFFAAGVKWWKFAIAGATAIASIPLVWQFLHQYQKKRILTFLDPENDPLGDGYNIMQSKIAIGSGGFTGKGFLKGTQSQLSFLPEKQTDFIFTMLSEEFGFIGGASILLLYAIIIYIGFSISTQISNHFGRLVAIGTTSIIFLHVFINTGMAMGMLPIVGAPLPLLSYGGTIMITILVAFGFLLNAHLHQDEKMNRGI